MKILFILTALMSLQSFADTCTVKNETSIRLFREKIPAGAKAINQAGNDVGLNDVLDDALFHFELSDGRLSKSYQWMYNPLTKLSDDEYVVQSFGETVSVKLISREDNLVEVIYIGSQSGNYLNLLCQR
ncbi:MAG: hypothetical protein ACLGG0_11785 [Bacteriovoracia bacterium]